MKVAEGQHENWKLGSLGTSGFGGVSASSPDSFVLQALTSLHHFTCQPPFASPQIRNHVRVAGPGVQCRQRVSFINYLTDATLANNGIPGGTTLVF